MPTVDNEEENSFLPAPPATLMKLNNSINSNIPVLIGSNANEGFWSLMYYLTDLMPNNELTPQERTLSQEEYYKVVESVFISDSNNVRLHFELCGGADEGQFPYIGAINISDLTRVNSA